MRQQWLSKLNITTAKTYTSMPVVSCALNHEELGLYAPADYGFIEKNARGKAVILRT